MEHPSGKENANCIASLKDSMSLQHLLAKHQREIEMVKRVKETELHRALCKFTKQNNQLISENSKLRDQKRKGYLALDAKTMKRDSMISFLTVETMAGELQAENNRLKMQLMVSHLHHFEVPSF